jgi:hypothetical protein
VGFGFVVNEKGIAQMIGVVRSFVIVFLLIILFSPGSRAQTINAASCSQTDVQTALNSVSADGTTVVIPAGNCVWSSAQEGQNYAVIYNKPYSVTIEGSGSQTTVGGGDATIIQDNLPSASDNSFTLDVASGKTLRLTAITLEAGTQATAYAGNLQISCNDTVGELRVDHVHLSNTSVDARFYDCFGVVDHSILSNSSPYNNDATVYDPSYGGGSNGDGSWAQPTDLGTAKFLFFENDQFNGGAADDCTDGGRAVFRYNTLTNQSAFQTHPTGGGGPDERGCRAWEIYGNTATGNNSDPQFNFDFVSSGTGVVWGNNASSGYQNFITIHSMRRDNSTYSESPTPTSWGYCGTSFNGTGSAWDGNSSTTTGYPCIDQPGRGQGDLITGYMPSALNITTKTISWVHEALEPVYEWLDNWTTAGGGSFLANYEPDVLVQNQDFYLYTGSFNGTSGVGSGSLSNRPTTCTVGVAYWATDQGSWNQSGNGGQGVLYKCTTANTWTSFYTPYTYPYPLGTVTDSGTSVMPPTGLVATVQ